MPQMSLPVVDCFDCASPARALRSCVCRQTRIAYPDIVQHDDRVSLVRVIASTVSIVAIEHDLCAAVVAVRADSFPWPCDQPRPDGVPLCK